MFFTIITIFIILLLGNLIPISKEDSKTNKLLKSLTVIGLTIAIQSFLFEFKVVNVLYTIMLIYVVSLVKGDEIHKIFKKDMEGFALSRYLPNDTHPRVYNDTDLYSNIRLNNHDIDDGIIYSNNDNKLIKCELDDKFWLGNEDPIKYCRAKLKREQSLWYKIKAFFGF